MVRALNRSAVPLLVVAAGYLAGCDQAGEPHDVTEAGVADSASVGVTDATPPTVQDSAPESSCAAEEEALLALVMRHKSCTTAADCRWLSSDCVSGASRDHCSSEGAFYVNRAIDQADAQRLDGALSACRKYLTGNQGDECLTCDGWPCLPECIDGMCAAPKGDAPCRLLGEDAGSEDAGG